MDGISAFALNTDSTAKRDVYNVIPTSQEGVAPTSTVFVGPTPSVCTQTNIIKRYGFGANANCGSTAQRTQ